MNSKTSAVRSIGITLLLLTILFSGGRQVAATTVIASDMVNSGSQNLISFENPFNGAFSSAADGFQKYQRNVSPSIPFAVLDDSLSIFTGDTQGIIKDGNTDIFFGVTDTENPDNAGPVSATWVFDVSGATGLTLAIDMGAMGDFEAGLDTFTWEYSFDGGPTMTAFVNTVDEAASHTYTLEGGASFILDDPTLVDGILLTNDMQTVSTALSGSGSQLSLTLTAQTDGGSEAFAFQNLIIEGGTEAADPVINEFVANHTGTDTEAFVEVFGAPSTDYTGLAILEIEGDGADAGIVDAVLPLGATDASGYWTDPEDMENGTLSILLVEGFTGSAGDDLDTDNDGVLDSTPWTMILDDVATADGDASDQVYSTTVLDPFFDGEPFGAGGASRIPNGTDTDSAGDWVRNDFDGFGFPGFVGSPALGEAENTPGAVNLAITSVSDPVGTCGDPATLIHTIQGSGLASDDQGNIREVEGVVVGDFQGGDSLSGFFLQEEDADADGDPQTSEGIFVFDGATPATDVNVGDVVRVRGAVSEFSEMTELTDVESVSLCVGTGTASAASMTLPVASVDDWEPVEGMLVHMTQTLFISEFFNFDRFNEIVLTTSRQQQPTAIHEPGSPEAAQLAADNLLARVKLDDGRTSSNPDPAIHPNGDIFDLTNTFRGGDSVANVTGVINQSFGEYRIQPTTGADYTSLNPRPEAPDDVGGSLTVASFNVLNYFLTLDDSGSICGPAQNQGCRGADNATELARQRAKIISASVDIGADIYGLIEMENTTGVEPLQDLVNGMNDEVGAGTYAFIDTGTIGGDAIRVGFIYNTTTVTPEGGHAILDSSVDSRFDDTKNRPALAQTFRQNSNEELVTVVVNHLKSKGSPCDDVGDPDLGDGAGNCNVTRTLAAEAMVDWLATDPTGSGTDNVLIIGDLNSYDKEDPIDALTAGGYTDLLLDFQGEEAYSYVFDGQLGYLDYALASAALLPQVTGTTAWHINADEPDILDYDTTFKQDAQDALYEPNAFRASDHDPVIVGLNLETIIDPDACVVLALEGSPFDGDAILVPLDHPSVKARRGIIRFSAPRWAQFEGVPIDSCFEVHGTDGRDYISGGRDDDSLFGYGGNDNLYGRSGDDIFTGGSGRDSFLGGTGHDEVTDFEEGLDRCSSIEEGC